MFAPLHVVLPPDVITGLTAVVGGFMMFVVVLGLKNVLGWIGIDLSGLAAGLAAALTGVAMAFIVGLVGLIPDEFGGLATELIRLLILLLSGFGFYMVFTKKAHAKQ